MMKPFFSIYTHGFARAAVCVPALRVADPAYNAERTLALARRAAEARRRRGALPRARPLGLLQRGPVPAGRPARRDRWPPSGRWSRPARELCPVLLVGAPLRFEGRLFNCAVAIYRGQILGVVPKSYLPNYREFYEKRQFAAAP